MASSVRTAQLGVAAILALSAATVAYVHHQQKDESRRLHEGVAKDATRMKWRQAEIEREKRELQGPHSSRT
jgi:hypothetical protein